MKSHWMPVTCLLLGSLQVLLAYTENDFLVNANRKELTDSPLFEYDNVRKPTPTKGLLYPRDSETREVRSLDGMWQLVRSDPYDPLQGIREKWFMDALRKTGREIISMPVPASYNDITTDNLRDHVGTVWYERTFFVPRSWKTMQRTWLRFSSVHYSAVVWINGRNATSHSIGHLPFESEISGLLSFGGDNRITVMCDNRLSNRTIPQGSVCKVATDDGTVPIQSYTFDFFNYAGIHRSVHLYTTPLLHISDLEVTTQLTKEGLGRIDYRVWLDASKEGLQIQPIQLRVQLRDKDGHVAAQQINKAVYHGTLLVPNATPWWPYLMHSDPGYLYNLQFELFVASNEKELESLQDTYRLPVGIRSLSWDNDSLLLNGKPLYLRGFGRHEDSDVSLIVG